MANLSPFKWRGLRRFFRQRVSGPLLNTKGEPITKPDLSRMPTRAAGPKRNWGAELYELYEYGLSLAYVDTIGFTEKLTLAWFTPSAMANRKKSKAAWGPCGVFVNYWRSGPEFWAAARADVGAWLVALGVAAVFLFPPQAPYWLFIALLAGVPLGASLIAATAPELGFWDISYELWVTPTT